MKNFSTHILIREPNARLIMAFFSFVTLMATTVLYSQNIYYDAKRLSSWKNITSSDPVKAREVLVIKQILKNYDELNENDSLLNDPILSEIDSMITTIGVAAQDKGLIIKKLISLDTSVYSKLIKRYYKENKKDTVFLNELRLYKLKIEQNSDALDTSMFYQKKIESLFNLWKDRNEVKYIELKPVLQYTDSICRKIGFITDTLLNASTVDTINRNKLDSIITSGNFIAAINRTLSVFMETESRAKAANNDTIYLKFNSISDIKIKKELVGEQFNEDQYRNEIEKNKEYIKNEIAIVTNSSKSGETEAFVKNAISDQNFPTQSEIIDALAIYISKRFKQDVALTFVENFGRYLKDNAIARDLFPTSYHMIIDSDPYNIPKVGSEWRNAVSKDLIELPQNMVNSTVVKRWMKNEASVQYLSDAVLIGRYVSEKYSFADMVRSIYLRNGVNGDSDSLRGDYTKRALLVSFIINEEFYDTLPSKYWIAPEQLYRMNMQELKIASTLLSVKYGNDFLKVFHNDPFKNALPQQLTSMSHRFTDVLSLMKQFENSQVSAYQANIQGGNLKDGFWDFQRSFMDFVVKQIGNEKQKAQVRNVQKMFFVYDYITNKNFGAAINTTLEILDTLLTENSPSRYLRAFTARDNIKTLDFVSLLDNITSNTMNQIYALEDVSKIQFMLGKTMGAQTDRINPNDIKTTYKAIFKEDWKEINDNLILGNLYQSDAHLPITTLMERTDKMFVSLRDSLQNAKELPENWKKEISGIHFHSFKTYTNENLQQYIALTDRFILSRSPNMITSFRKISGFLTDAASAKDSKELSGVLESYAQPPLSYKLTRKSLLSIDLSAFVGVWAGREVILDKKYRDNPNGNSPSWVAGLTVPVGLNFSWACRVKSLSKIKTHSNKIKTDNRLMYLNKDGNPIYLTGASHSIFLSIIDIAGPVSFRITNESASGLPKDVSWSQVLAPGIHYYYGLRNAPLCLNVGFQVSPQLRTFEDIQEDPLTMGRIQVGLTYELPLLNFKRSTPF